MFRISSLSLLFFFLIISSCSVSAVENKSDKKTDKPRVENEYPKGNHAHRIIPIIYGFPTDEDFRKSDSGLVALGGCE